MNRKAGQRCAFTTPHVLSQINIISLQFNKRMYWIPRPLNYLWILKNDSILNVIRIHFSFVFTNVCTLPECSRLATPQEFKP